MSALREILVSFGVEVDTTQIDKANVKTEGLIKKLEKFGKALAGVLVIKRVLDEAFDLTEQATAIEHTAEATGLSAKELQAWQLGAAEAGVEAEGLNLSLRKLSKQLGGGGEDAKAHAKLVKDWGLQAIAAGKGGITLSQALPIIAEKFKALPDGTAKSAKATELFGRQGARLIPLLNEGAAGIVKLKKELDELGGGFSDDFIKQSVEVDKQTKRLDVSWTSLKVKLFGVLLPALNTGVTYLIKFSVWTGNLVKDTNLLGSALTVLGALASAAAIRTVIAFWPVIAPFLAWAAAIGLVVLAVEDVYGFFVGKNSLIGKAIDEAFGPGSQDKVRKWAHKVVDFVQDAVSQFVAIFGDGTLSIQERLTKFLTWLGGKFHTDVTGTFGEIGEDISAIFKVTIDYIEASFEGVTKAIKFALKLLDLIDPESYLPKGDAGGDAGGGAPVRPATDDEIADAFGPAPDAGAGGFYAKVNKIAETSVTARAPRGAPAPPTLPSSWDAAPPIQNFITVPPGTPENLAQRVGNAAHAGTTRALRAPNRAAAASLARKGRK